MAAEREGQRSPRRIASLEQELHYFKSQNQLLSQQLIHMRIERQSLLAQVPSRGRTSAFGKTKNGSVKRAAKAMAFRQVKELTCEKDHDAVGTPLDTRSAARGGRPAMVVCTVDKS